jgi:hypothetical protein
MSVGQYGSLDRAVYLLLKWAGRKESTGEGKETAVLSRAVHIAYGVALCSIQMDLEREYLPELEWRYEELVALAIGDDPEVRPPDDVWLLVLTYLEPGEQRLLQATYEDLRNVLETLAMFQDDDAEFERTRAILMAVAPAEELLAELPDTTFVAASAPDDYDQRRRTLSIEIERPNDSEVYVEWLDGYESRVATMALLAGGGGACWQLVINDPPLSRAALLDLSGAVAGSSLLLEGERQTLDPRTRARLRREGCALVAAAAERELEKAIDWGTHELGDGFSVACNGLTVQRGRQGSAKGR